MVPEEKQQQCLVYTCITHLHFKSSMFATAEIFLLPSSNSALPLRKSGRQRSGRKKNPTDLTKIWVSWYGLGGRGFFPTLSWQCRISPVQDVGQTVYSPSSCTAHLMDSMKDMAFGHRERSTSTPRLPHNHQLFLPSIPLSDQSVQVPSRKDNISTEENTFCFLICKV